MLVFDAVFSSWSAPVSFVKVDIAYMGNPSDVLEAEAEADLLEQFQIWNVE